VGNLVVNNGRVWYQDATIRSRRGEPLLLDARGIQGQVQANGSEAATFQISLPSTRVGRSGTLVRDLALNGQATTDGRWATADLRWPSVPATLLNEYSSASVPVSLNAGTLGGTVRLAWDGALPAAKQLLAVGQMSLHNVAAISTRTIPNLREPLRVTKINGTVSFHNLAFSTQNVSFVAFDTLLRARGSLALTAGNVPVFDVVAQSQSADIVRLSSLVKLPVNVRGRARAVLCA
jgi:hypothetical protein